MATATENLLADYQELKEQHISMRNDIANTLHTLKGASLMVELLAESNNYNDTDAIYSAFEMVSKSIQDIHKKLDTIVS